MGLLRFLLEIDCRADLESENRIWSLWFVLCILNRASFMAVSSAVKILDIVGKLVENVSFELRKTAAAETLFELLEPSVKISWWFE